MQCCYWFAVGILSSRLQALRFFLLFSHLSESLLEFRPLLDIKVISHLKSCVLKRYWRHFYTGLPEVSILAQRRWSKVSSCKTVYLKELATLLTLQPAPPLISVTRTLWTWFLLSYAINLTLPTFTNKAMFPADGKLLVYFSQQGA